MTVVDLYTIQIIIEPDAPLIISTRTFVQWASIVAETEENLTDLLPPGYRARIRRWDHADPDEGNDDE